MTTLSDFVGSSVRDNSVWNSSKDSVSRFVYDSVTDSIWKTVYSVANHSVYNVVNNIINSYDT
jgi:ethanolamine ammonia-lyase large subunit